jgi:hypothetical protein
MSATAFGTAVTATSTGIGESVTGMITDAIRTAFPVGIYLRQEAAACGSTTARLAISPRRQTAAKRSNWPTDMAVG